MKKKKVQELKVFPSGMEGKEYENIIAFIEKKAEEAAQTVADDRQSAILSILRCIATDVGIDESTEI
jgi:hypothetical protein